VSLPFLLLLFIYFLKSSIVIIKFKTKQIPQQIAQKIETPILKSVVANEACTQKRRQTTKSKSAVIKYKNPIVFTPFLEVPFFKNGTSVEIHWKLL
jgi:hypothetical protein